MLPFRAPEDKKNTAAALSKPYAKIKFIMQAFILEPEIKNRSGEGHGMSTHEPQECKIQVLGCQEG